MSGRVVYTVVLKNSVGSTPTVSPFLPPVSSRNALLLQSLPTNIPFWQVNARRRKDDTRVGTAARGIVERLSRLSRRLQSDGGSSGRVRHALSTGARDQGRPALHAPLRPGAPVASATQACRGHRGLGRCRATGPARLYRYRTMGPPAVDRGVGGASGQAVGRARWHHRLRSEPFPHTRHALAVYLHPATNYHRLTRPTVTGAKRPRRAGSHGLPAAL